LATFLLVLGFSFEVKLSPYQPKSQQIRSLASSKMWQHEAHDEAAVMAASDGPGLASLELVSKCSVLLVVVAMGGTLVLLDRGVWLRHETASAIRRELCSRSAPLSAPPVL
jgi:hypothetical protein